MASFPEIPEFVKNQPRFWTDHRLVNVRHNGYAVKAYIPRTLSEHQKRKAEIIRRVKLAAGFLPEFQLPVNAPAITHRRVYQNVAIYDVEVETLPGLRLTGNLYLPEKITSKVPGILCPHGHWPNGRVEQSQHGNLRMRSFEFARLGFAVFAYDMVGCNENNDLPHRFSPALRKKGDFYGITPFGLQTANSLRALDLLSSLPEIDAERIGCTGASGGGSQTWFLGLLDERVKVLAPVCMLSCHYWGGCTCEEGPLLRTTGITSFDMVGALAPRPLLLPSVNGDWTLHVPEYEYPGIRQIYALYHAENQVENFHYPDEHNYNPRTCEHVYSFFLRHLAGKKDIPERVAEEKITPPPAELLWFTGQKPAPATPESTRLAFKCLKPFYASFSNPPVKTGKKILAELILDGIPPKDVVEHVGTRRPLPGGAYFVKMVSRRSVGDRINIVRIVPGHTEEMSGSGNAVAKTGFLMIADSLFQLKEDAAGTLAVDLCERKIPGMVMELLGSGMSAGDLKRTIRDFSVSTDLAFNPSLYSMRVQDILTVHTLLRERGFEKVVLLASPEHAPAALAAVALLPEADAVCDLQNLRENVWQKQVNYQPLLGRIGGIRGLVRLASRPGVTFVHAEKYAAEIQEGGGTLSAEDFDFSVKNYDWKL